MPNANELTSEVKKDKVDESNKIVSADQDHKSQLNSLNSGIKCPICLAFLEPIESIEKPEILDVIRSQDKKLEPSFSWNMYLENCNSCMEKNFYENILGSIVKVEQPVSIKSALLSTMCKVKIRCVSNFVNATTVIEIDLKRLYGAAKLLDPFLLRFKSKYCCYCYKQGTIFNLDCCSICLENGCYSKIYSSYSSESKLCSCNAPMKEEFRVIYSQIFKLMSGCFKCGNNTDIFRAYFNLDKKLFVTFEGEKQEIFEKAWIFHFICSDCYKDGTPLSEGIDCRFCDFIHSQAKNTLE